MKTRVISAIIALPLVIVTIYLGGLLMYGVILVAIAIGLFELTKAFKITSKVLYVIPLFCSFLFLVIHWFKLREYVFGASALLMILLLAYFVVSYPKVELNKIFVSLVSFYYITIMISHIIYVRELENYGNLLVWMIFIISFGSDSFAYFTGVLIGKHPLAPVLSPKKTIEGAVGGVVGAGFLSGMYALYMKSTGLNFETIQILAFVMMGCIGSVFSQFGDMAASAMKRVAGIKDFGKFMPGHGGIIDRMDSIIFVAPFVYFASMFILKKFL